MFALKFSGELLFRRSQDVLKTSACAYQRISLPHSERFHLKNYVARGELDDVEFPPERRKLHPLPRIPILVGERMYKYPRRHYDLRGPETINHLLRHNQFGIQVTCFTMLKCAHIFRHLKVVSY